MEQKNFMGRTIFYILLIVVVGILSFFVGRLSNSGTISAANPQQTLPKPTADTIINKSFSFPIKDQNNAEIASLQFTLESADLMDEIIIKGQPATAVNGKTFLIINLKLENPSSKSIIVNSRDYIRLSENKTSDLLAPDVHNDPVEIQPISTKITRVGFPINTTDKNLVLHVGEINGTKTDIPISFK